jgi:hypothetical protein
VLWEESILDGHHRYEICQRHKIQFKTVVKSFDTREQAKLWIISNQLSRRNISPEQRTYLIGIQYKLEKKGQGGDHKSKDQNEPLINTAEKIGQQHHVSSSTVKRAEKFADAVDKLPSAEKKKMLPGKSRKTKKQIMSPLPLDAEESKISSDDIRQALQNYTKVASRLIYWWKKAKASDLIVFQKFLQYQHSDPPPVVPADLPLGFIKYIKCLREAWEMIPEGPPELKEDGQRQMIETYADKFFRLLEPFFKVMPSNEYLRRMRLRRDGDGQ